MLRPRGIFITGTDTNIGKTITASILYSALQQNGNEPGYFKPIQTGTDSDTRTVRKLTEPFGSFPLTVPIYEFPEPIAPSRAAKLNGVEIQLHKIQEAWKQLPQQTWIVEGAGGLMVPLSSKIAIRNLVKELDLNLLIVASTRLGTINHTLLTIESAKTAQIRISGVILIGHDDRGLEESISEFSGIPILARIPQLTEITPESIRTAARNCFPPDVLGQIFKEMGCSNE